MNNIKKYAAWLGAGAILLTLTTGCPAPVESTSNVVESGVESTGNMADAAGDTAGNMADAAGNNLDAAGGAMVNGANTAVDATGNAMDATGSAMANGVDAAGTALGGAADAAIYTPKIKAALATQETGALAGSKINVDTLPDKQIALRGTVTSDAQMKLAESIAKKEAPGFTIVNQLKMGGKM